MSVDNAVGVDSVGGPGTALSDVPADALAQTGSYRSPFGERLVAALERFGPLCAGIDPHRSLLAEWSLPGDARGVETFGLRVVEALAGEVAVFKPQSAFFEAHGSAGIVALERTLAAAAEAGVLTLLDVKRGDIGSTMQAYAEAYLADGSPLAADAITVSPFLGFGSLQPAIDLALATGRGLFVLAATSNPEGPSVQQAREPDGTRTISQSITDAAASLNRGVEPLGSIGLVVGATVGRIDLDVAALNGPILAPGVGAQGGTGAALRDLFGPRLRGVLPSSSREILSRGPSVAGLRDAARRTLDGIRAAMA